MSPEKRTRLGAGHFVETCESYYRGDGAVVANCTETRCSVSPRSRHDDLPRLAWDDVTVPAELAEVVDEISYERVVMNAGTTWDYFPWPLRPGVRQRPRASNDFRQHDAPRRVHRPDRDRLRRARTAGWCGARCRCSVRSTQATPWSARGRVVDKRIDTAGETPRYLVDLEVAIFNQRDELCCPAEVTVELTWPALERPLKRGGRRSRNAAMPSSRIVGVKGGDLVRPLQFQLSEKRVVE